MIVMKSWPTTIHFFFYLPIAILWSVLFYCKQGTDDYEKMQAEKEEEEEAAPKNAIETALADAKNAVEDN